MRAYDADSKGYVFNIQRFSVHDGPGIRTVVFLKGCPLRCPWCSNPESQRPEREIMFHPENCIGCGQCAHACPAGAVDFSLPHRVDRAKCTGCGECEKVCYANALVMAGEEKTVADVLRVLDRDSGFYRTSGGGITFSGGEPLAQHAYLEQLLAGCKASGWHTAIETTGFAARETLERILPLLDLILADVKHMDGAKHKEYTGVSNEGIQENIQFMAGAGKRVVIRVPVIPGFNDDPMNIRATAGFAKSLPSVEELHLLPYHRLGQEKYGYLCRDYRFDGIVPPPRKAMEGLKSLVESFGLRCSIGGS